MIVRKLFFVMVLFASAIGFVPAQGRPTSQEELIKTGVSFYSEGKFTEAAGIFQIAAPSAEALYWLSLSELSLGNFEKSLSCLDRLEKADNSGIWSEEVNYHRGRCYYYLGRHEQAINCLTAFSGKLPDSDPRKPSAYYWQGESLLALGKLDSAATAFSNVVENYPGSSKYEAAYYRLNIINQKRIEAELLAILKWSHEESLKTMEEYQSREKNYEAAIASYQRRINELLAASGEANALNKELSVLSAESADFYLSRIVAADQKIAELEESLAEANAALIILRGENSKELLPLDSKERGIKLEELKNLALELTDILTTKLEEVQE